MLRLTEAFDLVYRDFENYISKLKQITPKQYKNILLRLQKAQNKAIKKYYSKS